MTARNELPGVVRKICLWCQGDSWKQVEECTLSSCSLHAVRMDRDLTEPLAKECIVAYCLQCAGSAEDVEECSAYRPFAGHPACPAHPFRRPGPALPVQNIVALPGLAPPDVTAFTQKEDASPGANAEPGPDSAPPQPSTPQRPSQSDALAFGRAPEALDI